MNKKDVKNLVVGWLENVRSAGAFEGFAEEKMDFNTLSPDEISWYFHEWVLPDLTDSGLELSLAR